MIALVASAACLYFAGVCVIDSLPLIVTVP